MACHLIRRWKAKFVASAALLVAAPAIAQPATGEPTSSAHAIVAPVRISDSAVSYPEGAAGDATVVLTLTVSASGVVQSAVPTEPNEPFSRVAGAAALTWRFAPATRDGRPIAARIRVEVVFHAPATLPAASDSAPADAATSPPDVNRSLPAPPPAAIEVWVQGERGEPSRTATLSRAEVRQLPGAFGDPFRALEALPGVTPIASGLPFFYVRGAPPGNIGYFIDGVRVPYLFHVGAGPSVIHPGMVESVNLYAGGYPARYGHFAGGIVAAETTAPRNDAHGEGNVRLFDLGALVETGFAGGRGTALVAGRYSYTAAVLSLIAKDTQLAYRDYEARLTYDLSANDRLSLVSFGSYDLVGQTQNNIDNVLFASEFYRADLRYDHTFSPNTTLRAAFTLGFDQTRIPDQPRNSRSTLSAARLEFSHGASASTLLRAGLEATVEAFGADTRPYSDPEDPDTVRFNALFPGRNDVTIGGWVAASFRWGAVEVTPGARVDFYSSNGATAIGVDPRISSRLELAKTVHAIHTFGIAHQPPSFLIPIPGLAIGQLQGGLQQSLQASGGVEVDLPEATTATVSVFDNIFLNMSDTLGVSQQRGLENGFREPRSLGSALGLELYLRRKLTRRVGGYLAYTLSRSTRSVASERFLSAFDRTHVANAAVAYNLGRNWRAGTRFTIYSGTPVIPPTGGALIAPPRSLHPDRDPAFYRFDVRFEKRWDFSKTVWLSFVAEMMNVTLHTEVLLGQTIGPVSIPSLGVEGAF